MAPYQAHVRNAHQAAKRTSEEEGMIVLIIIRR